jgi:hypothetical protein
MSGLVKWIGAEDGGELPKAALKVGKTVCRTDGRDASDTSNGGPWRGLPAHSFPSSTRWSETGECASDRNPDVWLYRDRTIGLLRRYLRFSLETGRLPSMVGREFFRAKVSAYPAASFEDRVIFVRDVEKCLERLEYWDQQLIARVILQEHSQEQAAYLLHCNRKMVQRRLQEVLDLLSEDFLKSGLLVELTQNRRDDQD